MEVDCYKCGGHGWVATHGYSLDAKECPKCEGTGKLTKQAEEIPSGKDFDLNLLDDLEEWQQPDNLMKDLVKKLVNRHTEMYDRIGISILMDYLDREPGIREVANYAKFSHRMNSGFVSFSWRGEEIARVSRPTQDMNFEGGGPNYVSLGTSLRIEIDLSYREENNIKIMSSWDYAQWVDKQKN